MNDENGPCGSGRTELRSSTAMPGLVAAPLVAASDWEDADPAMEQLDVVKRENKNLADEVNLGLLKN